MPSITPEHIDRLIAIESHVHYGEPPPPGVEYPFVVVDRNSPVLLSAPHGARTYRNPQRETWHEEDEYTAGLALLLSELCGTSAIATIWRTDDSDPNYHGETRSAYKCAIRRLEQDSCIRWVIDLHGAASNSTRLDAHHLVDIGTRGDLNSLPEIPLNEFVRLLEQNLGGTDTVSQNRFPAEIPKRAVTAYCHGELDLKAVQVEMKPTVRVAFRRTDASSFADEGPYSAPVGKITGMMQALANFVKYLQNLEA